MINLLSCLDVLLLYSIESFVLFFVLYIKGKFIIKNFKQTSTKCQLFISLGSRDMSCLQALFAQFQDIKTLKDVNDNFFLKHFFLFKSSLFVVSPLPKSSSFCVSQLPKSSSFWVSPYSNQFFLLVPTSWVLPLQCQEEGTHKISWILELGTQKKKQIQEAGTPKRSWIWEEGTL